MSEKIKRRLAAIIGFTVGGMIVGAGILITFFLVSRDYALLAQLSWRPTQGHIVDAKGVKENADSAYNVFVSYEDWYNRPSFQPIEVYFKPHNGDTIYMEVVKTAKLTFRKMLITPSSMILVIPASTT